jgi:hypothetical protein
MMIRWREKFIAFSLHFLVTLGLAAVAAAMIFLIWFPDPFEIMLGGVKLFMLVSICDLVLGPLTSFIVYDSRKTRRALVFDYTVIGVVQLTAFVYGVVAMANSRPAYIAFAKDQLEVVQAGDLADEDLAAAQPQYRSRPKWGPVLVGTVGPTGREERNQLLLSAAMQGKDRSSFPRYYVPYEKNLDEIKSNAKPIETLERKHPDASGTIAAAAKDLGIPKERLRWLNLKHEHGFGTALLDIATWRPVRYLDLDPE